MWYAPKLWLLDSDRMPMGDPETRVEMPGDLTLGLNIPNPFGRDSDAMLAVRAVEVPDEPGGVITLAITTVVKRATVDLREMRSNPRRYVDADHWHEDGA